MSRKLLTTNIGTRFAATLVFWLRSLSWVSSNPLPTTGVELALDFDTRDTELLDLLLGKERSTRALSSLTSKLNSIGCSTYQCLGL
ncbi:hypothetical protein DIPPA_26412 [Diplonema papillatum]|nr:hypothetical protein DIPPA_26412 [Diplonema papillatum]